MLKSFTAMKKFTVKNTDITILKVKKEDYI